MSNCSRLNRVVNDGEVSLTDRSGAPKSGTSLELLKGAERTKSGALKVDNATLQ